MPLKSQKRQRLIVFIFINAIQYPCTLKNNIYYSNKRGSPPFFHSDTNPVLDHVLFHSVDKTHVTVKLIWLFLNMLSFNFVPISQEIQIQKKLRKPPCCCSNQPLSKLHCFFAEQCSLLISIQEQRKLWNICPFYNINITIYPLHI